MVAPSDDQGVQGQGVRDQLPEVWPMPSDVKDRSMITRFAAAALTAGLMLMVLVQGAAAQSRIKDIADFEGVRENMLIGYGLIVGLDGTGDSLNNAPFTKQSLEAMLERLGVNIRAAGNYNTKNLAAVMVTATLPPFARHGQRIDVSVGTMGDAKSLVGGQLLVTPLYGADGEVYAVAQGAIAAGGFKFQGQAALVQRGVVTSGRISNGAIVEREVGFELAAMPLLRLSLRNPDLTTSRRMAQAISTFLGQPAARALDPSTVQVDIPDGLKNDVIGLMTQIEQLVVQTDQTARVVIDEKTGVIVMGANVRVDTVAIAQGNLTVRITETPQVSQPAPFSSGGQRVPRLNADGTVARDAQGNILYDNVGGAQTVVVPRTDIQVDDQGDRRLSVLRGGVSLQELVDGLNALGVGPRDMISILQTIKAAGALRADLQMM